MGRSGVIHATYPEPEALARAMDALAAEGFDPEELEVRSSTPVHEHRALPGVKVRSRVVPAAVLGGLLGGLMAFLTASLTALDYPLPTGGMPIVALPPVGIITYEGTALGAILLTVGTVLAEARLGRPGGRGPSPLDGRVAAGELLLLVDAGEPTRRHQARQVLTGASRIEET